VAGSQTNGEVLLDLTGPGPRHEQLARALRQAIRDGGFEDGAAVPPSRRLAADLGCSRWVVTQAYAQLGTEPNQLAVQREVQVTPEQLLDVSSVPGKITEQGLRSNVEVAVLYLESWLRGNGAVGIHNLMEDAATAEISRSQVWQWLHNGVELDTGATVTLDFIEQVLDEESAKIRNAVGEFLKTDFAKERFKTLGYAVTNYDEKKSAEIIGASKNIAQFLDRDTRPDFASTVMIPSLQQFIRAPEDIDGLLKSIEDGWVAKGSTVVCTVTGNGLKDPDTALKGMPAVTPVPVDPTAVVEKLGLV
jgi:hypothetical protein